MSSHIPFYLSTRYSKYAILKLFICPEYEHLYDLYKAKANEHNQATNDNEHFNAGFDLFIPHDSTVETTGTTFIKMGVKAEMVENDGSKLSYYMYPRSSISKTPLMLANHVGIIDSGYRGELTGAFRCLDNMPYYLQQGTRVLQVCSPKLSPLYVVVCDKESDLGITARGEGGFGSTGK